MSLAQLKELTADIADQGPDCIQMACAVLSAVVRTFPQAGTPSAEAGRAKPVKRSRTTPARRQSTNEPAPSRATSKDPHTARQRDGAAMTNGIAKAKAGRRAAYAVELARAAFKDKWPEPRPYGWRLADLVRHVGRQWDFIDYGPTPEDATIRTYLNAAAKNGRLVSERLRLWKTAKPAEL